MTRKHYLSGILNLFIGILFLILFISIGLHIAIYCRPLYYSGIDKLSESIGYTSVEIKENYNTLIDYCSPFYTGELKFPTLPASESGLSHFSEVKDIFNVFFALLFICPILIAVLIYIQHKRKVNSYLLTSPIIMCISPIIVSLLCAIDFKTTFKTFHEIVFSNDDWIFDPVTDPIIDLLPYDFFLQCAVIMIITVLIGCLILLTIYFINRHYNKTNNTIQ